MLAWYAARKLLGFLLLLLVLLSLRRALSKQSLLPTGAQAPCATGEKETWISRAQEGEGLTCLPPFLASVLIHGSQCDVIGDLWR